MIVVERTFAVAAGPGSVLAYLRDFANAQEWDPSAERTSRLGAGPVGPGAHWKHVRKLFGVTAELTYTLVSAEPGRLVFHGRSEGATCTDTALVRAVPGGTEVTYRVELEMHGLAKLATPVLKAELEKMADESVTAVTAALTGAGPETATRWLPRGATAPTLMPSPAEETG